MKPVISGKLTKRFLMSLETGQYIVSNVCNQEDGRFEPCFREKVLPLKDREKQWQRIKSACADGRLCNVLGSEMDCEAYIKSLPIPGQ